jgi:hypothetical protein
MFNVTTTRPTGSYFCKEKIMHKDFDAGLTAALNAIGVPEVGQQITAVVPTGGINQFGKVVSIKVNSTYDPDNSWHVDTGYRNGEVIIDINGVLFRKEGFCDSWTTWDWDGPATRVVAETVTETKYKALGELGPFDPKDIRIIDDEILKQDFGYLDVGESLVTTVGTLTMVSKWGDRDGDGEQVSRVFTVNGGEQLYRWEGYLSSWEGVEFSGFPYPVVAKDEVVVRYHREPR